jgi:MFS transporter, SP family, solute carrier family 2 (myo-inositol transporter), member 13
MGRRPALILADILFISGSLLMGLAATLPAVILGRFLVGLGVGVASVIVPVFLAECSELSCRAELVTANVLMITAGQFVSYLVNYGFSHVSGTWRWMLGVAAVPALLQLVGLRLLPETPQWLLSQVRHQRCPPQEV